MYRNLANDMTYRPLVEELKEHANAVDTVDDWPRSSLQACGDAGVHRWFLSQNDGGTGWTEPEVTCGYLMLSQYCMTTSFILTQRTGAMKRIAGSGNEHAKREWLPGLLSGELFGTVGISHLTTSRQHVGQPVLRATPLPHGSFRLDGYSPWVTGGIHADVIVVGATLENQEQILVAVPKESLGVEAFPGCDLVALSASCTDRVNFNGVLVEPSNVLAGPSPDVMKQGVGAGTGGLQTSTLAMGLSMAAIEFLEKEAEVRVDLEEVAKKMRADVASLIGDLLEVAAGKGGCTPSVIRQRANSLALRSTQGALTAAKGAGFVQGHPAGRWARESLFFLVWSCPQNVLHANLCELAGL